MVQGVVPKPIDGVFRVPADRAFTIKGHGTVVAGIPVSGSAVVGDQVELLPHGQTGRIRGIEVYGQAAERVMAGQCAALNVGHWEHQAVSRGDVVASPGYFQPHEWFVCSLRMLPHDGLVLKNGGQGPPAHGDLRPPGRALLAGRGPRGGRGGVPRSGRGEDFSRGRPWRPLHPADAVAGPDGRRRRDHRAGSTAGRSETGPNWPPILKPGPRRWAIRPASSSTACGPAPTLAAGPDRSGPASQGAGSPRRPDPY